MNEYETKPVNPYAEKPRTSGGKPAKTSVMAVFSMVFGFLSLLFSFVAGLIGIILGVVSLIRINNSNGKLKGAPFAIIGIVASVCLSLFSLLFIAMLLPAVQQVREAARRVMSTNNVRQMTLAQLNYESSYQVFPGKAMSDVENGGGLSWRVHILPYMEQQVLYEKFKLDEPWDSPHNQALIQEMPEIYLSQGGLGSDSLSLGETLFLRPIGNGAWPDPSSTDFEPLKLNAITDGTSRTISIVEVDASHAAIWTKPDGDYHFDPSAPDEGLKNQRIGVTIVSLVDGSTIAIPNDTTPETFGGMMTISGGEDVQAGLGW